MDRLQEQRLLNVLDRLVSRLDGIGATLKRLADQGADKIGAVAVNDLKPGPAHDHLGELEELSVIEEHHWPDYGLGHHSPLAADVEKLVGVRGPAVRGNVTITAEDTYDLDDSDAGCWPTVKADMVDWPDWTG
jgi:hypothetical protein